MAFVASRIATWRRVIGSAPKREIALVIAALGQIAAMLGFAAIVQSLPDPTRHAYAAATMIILLYAGLQSAIGLVFTGFGIWRSRTGYVSPIRSVDLRIGTMWQGSTAAIGAATLLIVYGLPQVMG